MNEIIWYAIGLAGMAYGLWLFRTALRVRDFGWKCFYRFDLPVSLVCMLGGLSIILVTIILQKP